MSSGKLLEFFIRIPKLLPDGSNWVIFKDRFAFAAAAAILNKHLNGTASAPVAPAFSQTGPAPLTAAETIEVEAYEAALSIWQTGEAVLKQAIASTIPDSLFLDVRKELTAKLMWDAVTNKREKKSRMVTVDLRRKLQSEKCEENGDVRAHLIKLQTMREDLASMGGSINDEDFTSIILGSIPLSYDTFISAMSATSTLLGSSLSPTNLIDAIGDEADRKAIKSPAKSKKDEHDAAFTAGPSSKDGRRGGRSGGSSGSKKPKRDVECFNCHKKGHMKADCWAPGGGSEGKGPRGRKGKETAAKASPEADADGVWMANAEDSVRHYKLERFVHQWRADIPQSDGELLWDASELAGETICGHKEHIDECFASQSNKADHTIKSPLGIPNHSDDLSSESDISEFMLVGTSCPSLKPVSDSSSESSSDASSCPNLRTVSSSSASDCGDGPADVPIFLPKDIGLEAKTHTYDAAMLANSMSPGIVETELYDSGASRHMSPYRDKFIDYIDIEPKTITAADSGTFQAIGRGDMHILVPNGKSTTRILLRDVLYAPKMGLTLVSISRIASAGFDTIFRQQSMKIYGPRNGQLGCVKVQGGLYRVEHDRPRDTAASASAGTVTIEELHRLMGHISPQVARSMVAKDMVHGIKLDGLSEMKSCDSCEYGKAHRKPIAKVREAKRAKEVGEEVHSDVWGPSPVRTINGREYYVTFTDDHSRFTHLYLLRTKDETFEAYTTYEAMMQMQKGTRIKKLHSDRGGEYLSGPFDNHLAKAGTLRNLTVHDTPEHNGISERLNRTILEKVRAMLHASGLPKFLWGEAAKHAVYLKNCTPTTALGEQTPFEAFFEKKPNLEGLHEFGAKVWVHDANGSKLDGRSNIGCWVGFDETSSGHRIYWPDKRSVSVERSVKFDNYAEILVPNSVPLEGSVVTPLSQVSSLLEQPTAAPITPATFSDNPTVDHLGKDFEHPPSDQGRPKRVRQESAAVRRLRDGEGFISDRPSERNQLPKGIQEADEAARMAQSDGWEVIDLEVGDMASGMVAAMAEADALEPTYEEARNRSDWPQWKAAIEVELENLQVAGTWDVVERPASTNVVDSKWVFRIKKNADGSIDKYKARLVARGFTQVYGVDYYETFAPVAKLASIRSILAIAARNDWPIDMFDFHSAFLNGELDVDEDIYMEQPPNHAAADPDRYVVKLHKSIYGLKQAGKKWYDSLSRSLADIGFQKSEADPAIYIYKSTHVLVTRLSYLQFMLMIAPSRGARKPCKMTSRRVLVINSNSPT
jgi:hypothetical protein